MNQNVKRNFLLTKSEECCVSMCWTTSYKVYFTRTQNDEDW